MSQPGLQRTDRWLDECCRPIFTLLVTMSQSRVAAVKGFVTMLEKSDPQVVEAMLELEKNDPKIMGGWGTKRPFFSDDGPPKLEEQLTRFTTGACKSTRQRMLDSPCCAHSSSALLVGLTDGVCPSADHCWSGEAGKAGDAIAFPDHVSPQPQPA